jgi:hypothetical protein
MSNSPEQHLTCPNGHEFVVSDVVDKDSVACPECLEPVSLDDSSAPTKRGGMGLWAVMQGGGEQASATRDADESVDESGESESDASQDSAEQPTDATVSSDSDQDESEQEEPGEAEPADVQSEDDAATQPNTGRPKGLWALMGGGSAPPSSGDAKEEEAASGDPSESDSLSEHDDSDSVDNEVEDDNEDQLGDEEVDDGEIDDEIEHDGWEVDDPDDIDDLLTPPGLRLEPRPSGPVRPVGKPTGSYVALAVGASALLLSVLSLLPYSWGRYPATPVGLFALVLGYQALGECQRFKRPAGIRVLPMLGMTLGVLGMFAGPMFLNGLGAEMRKNAIHAQITINMKKIDNGLSGYHERHDRYPPGSKHEADESGVEIPMHSWMTAILPHMGEDRLVSLIDASKPFDHDVNFEAMRHVVPAFLVPGVPHHANHLGFGTSHFSGVGGQITTDTGLVNLGVFERNSTTSRVEITDGQSQTMLIGEIAAAHPAWGEPDNWRSIGAGLNQRITGFGNANGTGAHFLMADGSVKFFGNRTSTDVLQALSTRDGEDPVQIK